MFEHFSQRERLLAIVAGIMAPMFVLIFAGIWFMNSLSSYDSRIAELQSQVTLAKSLNDKAQASERRRKHYLDLSLASTPELAKVQYRQWLSTIAEEIFGGNGYVLESITSSPVRFQRNIGVADKLSVKLNVPQADLGKLDEFLYRFYDAKILHRISSLSVTPTVAKMGSAEELLPTGKISLLIQIEAMSLLDADKSKTVSYESSGSMPRELAAYREMIESRNIFGLPNGPPQITSSLQPSEFEGRDIDLSISVRDPDETDQLKFELISSDVEDATLTQRDSTSRSATFASKALSPGSYKFRVRVTDSGFPPKSDEREFTLQVKEREVVAEAPRSKFEHAQEAVIVAIVKNSAGVTQAWIHARTLGKTFKVAVGDSFDLDEVSWKLVHLDHQALTLEVRGKLQTYRIGDHLDRPRNTTSQPTAASADRDSVGG